jgi:hypothetical protein
VPAVQWIERHRWNGRSPELLDVLLPNRVELLKASNPDNLIVQIPIRVDGQVPQVQLAWAVPNHLWLGVLNYSNQNFNYLSTTRPERRAP